MEITCCVGRSVRSLRHVQSRSRCQFPIAAGNRRSQAVIVVALSSTGRTPETQNCEPTNVGYKRQYGRNAWSTRLFSGGPRNSTESFSPLLLTGAGVVLLFERSVEQLSTLKGSFCVGLDGNFIWFDERLPPFELFKRGRVGQNAWPATETDLGTHARFLVCCHFPSQPSKTKSQTQTWVIGWGRRECLTGMLRRGWQQVRSICTLLSLSAKQRNPDNSSLQLWVVVASAAQGQAQRGNSSSSGQPLHRSKTAYYEILQVSPSATQALIKTAYYKQSLIYHPDRNGGSEEAARCFTEINEAYSVLGNIALRRKYDRGFLTPADLRGSGIPSVEEAPGSGEPTPPPKRARHSWAVGADRNPIFNFDEFYRAHYGEQLQREKEIRWRREQVRQWQQEGLRKWKRAKLTELSVAGLLTLGLGIIVSLHTGD